MARREIITHELKTEDRYFDAVKRGEKTFEVRKNDRAFQTGDIVTLIRIERDKFNGGWMESRDPIRNTKTTVTYKIGWVLQGGQFGIEPGYCVFSLAKA